jgi:tetratricopeptide (TPR) repeat protein
MRTMDLSRRYRPYALKAIVSVALVFVFGTAVYGQVEQQFTTAEGVRLYRAGNIDEAITHLRRVVETNKKDYTAWLYLGAAYVHKGNRKEAEKALKLGSRGPKYSDRNLGRIGDQYSLRLLSIPQAYLTNEARLARISANQTVAVECRYDDTIGFVFPIGNLPAGLTESAVEAARQIRFHAGTQDGEPVTTVILIEFGWRVM